MADPVSLAVLSGAVLTQGIKFLYDQASDVLARRRDRKQKTPEIVAEPRVLGEPSETRLTALEEQLRVLHDDLEGRDFAAADDDLLWRADALRAVLEAVYRTRLVFTGETRPATEAFSDIDVDDVRGYVAAIRGDSTTKGRLEARMRVRRVAQGGEAIGIDLRNGGS